MPVPSVAAAGLNDSKSSVAVGEAVGGAVGELELLVEERKVMAGKCRCASHTGNQHAGQRPDQSLVFT